MALFQREQGNKTNAGNKEYLENHLGSKRTWPIIFLEHGDTVPSWEGLINNSSFTEEKK